MSYGAGNVENNRGERMRRTIFDETTDVDVLALAELAPELRNVIEALLEHVDDGDGRPVCGAPDFEPDLLVDAALASDCARCRTVRMIDDEKGQRPVLTWTPEPMADAEEIIASARRNRDGVLTEEEEIARDLADGPGDGVL